MYANHSAQNNEASFETVPNSAAIQVVVDEFEDKHLRPHMEVGNLHVRNLYADLELPWTLTREAAGSVSEFDEGSFFRRVWDGGDDDDDDDDDDGKFLMSRPLSVNLDTLERMVGTGSPITRWREEHPDAAGTEQDVVRVFRREVERLLHEAGVEKGKEMVEGSQTGVLLVVKKKV
ncbi:hypothetical protein EMPG_12584 [Blastomyces silverae]|uniref:Uncharacterized protein n=1 Tax=Blastomyces silverae TaxID=2060906 RepID=A0A0H1BMP8_9EURO|nr:hypothetical protein EMPG_12584 [Blastomyces silverae]